MSGTKTKIQLLLTFTFLFIGLSLLALMNTVSADETGTRSGEFNHTPSDVSLASTGNNTTYTSPEFTAQFTFNGLGLTWTGTATSEVNFALQVNDGDWTPVEMQGNDAKDQSEHYTSVPVFVTGQRVRYKITGAHADAVQNVQIIYFDSTVPPYHSLASTLRQTFNRSAQSSIAVISRSDWGADESYRTWEPEYTTPEKFVIHHSAGGDGGDDPAATIRGIYYWHAVVLGWGDIGYNYIVDPSGNVYEGRYGGDGVIGAHAYNSDTDTNYNVNSVGIMLLGCYEEDDGACGTVHTMTPEMTAALEQLIADKGATFNVDPSGTSDWYGESLPNVLGHRDVDSTYCPGSIVHDQLESIRAAAHTLYSATHQRSYAASFSGSNLATSYTVATTTDLSLRYTNTGSKKWNKDKVVLQVRLEETGERQRFTLTDSVEDGNTTDIVGAFTLPTQPGNYTLVTRLYRNGSPIHGSKHSTTVTIENPYQAKMISASLPVAIQQGWQPTAELTIRNTGVTLPVGTTLEIDGTVVATISTEWPVNEKRSFTPKVEQAATWPVGTHKAVIKLKVESITVANSRTTQTVRVDIAQ
jgi:hypothetical protein